ncbi:sensor histidine kinase [Flavihumibacter sp. UBA7668]|uniref:sensor histidine kinase n=1 Tax=Flavihumibacter sp. UBA7668 TaxID=1946542 RepID=UPI0025B9F826|nr:histidine kinase [Flavihumibacter sp. UBA7668]
MYLLLRVLIEFLWVKGVITELQPVELMRGSFLASLIYLIPEIMFSYYLLCFGLDRVLKKSQYRFFYFLEIVLVLSVTIYCMRILAHNLVAPYAYQNQLPLAPVLGGQRILLLLVDIIFASGVLLAIEFTRRQLEFKEREKELIREKLSAELQLLRNQINPHFLFNTLNNIYALTRKKSDKAPEVVMKLSELLSFMLYKSSVDTITIQEEVRVLEDYIELEKIRYDQRLSIRFTRVIDDPSQRIIPLVFLPLVENAFKHGISESRFDSFVHIDLRLKKGKLLFTIENSVEKKEQEVQVGNIGLYNTQRQLELTYKEYRLDRESNQHSFKLNLDLNLMSYGKI